MTSNNPTLAEATRVICSRILSEIRNAPVYHPSAANSVFTSSLREQVEASIRREPEELRNRVMAEFFGVGPLEPLLGDSRITEILVNSPNEIYVETNGLLQRWKDSFMSNLTWENFIHLMCREMGSHINLDQPFACGQWRNLRAHIAHGSLSDGKTKVSLRRHSDAPWTFSSLAEVGWCSSRAAQFLNQLIKDKKNILVIGPTGAGKTSVLNACLQTLLPNERAILLEDARELSLPNQVSLSLLTREDPNQVLNDVTLTDLLKQALRMRPDRLVVGEIRGAEAKDLLLTLSTGHAGSLGTLHAHDVQEALIRLEMLIQMGASNWSLSAIRRLIFLCIQYVVVASRDGSGARRLGGIYRISGLEDFGLLTENVIV